MDNILNSFLQYLQKELFYSKHTISAYKNDLGVFARFLGNYDSNIGKDINNIDHNTIRHFLGREFELERSSKTIARRLASLKSFFKYLKAFELIKMDPTLNIKTPKVEKYIPDFVQLKKINQLMNLPDVKTIKGARDKTILEIFYATGIRLSELVSLNIGSIDHRENILKVLGKGKKERIIPFGMTAKSAMEDYLKMQGRSLESNPGLPLFTSNGKKRISKRTIQERLSKYLQIVLGSRKGASPHTLRHTFGTHLLDNDADIRSIQELLGHSSISSTQIYTKVNPQKLKKIYNKAHPHAK